MFWVVMRVVRERGREREATRGAIVRAGGVGVGVAIWAASPVLASCCKEVEEPESVVIPKLLFNGAGRGWRRILAEP